MSWVSSAHLPPRSAAFAPTPTRWKTSRATSPTRRPRRSSASIPRFLDLIPQTAATAQLAGGVTTQSRSTNSVQGDVQSASVATFMAINGNGFFAVQKPGTFTDGTPVFDGVDRYTRRGDFQLDKSGYLVNGAGYYLQGVPIDPTTGNPLGQLAAGPAIPERLPAGAGDHQDRLPRQPRQLSADDQARHVRSRIGIDRARFIQRRTQSAGARHARRRPLPIPPSSGTVQSNKAYAVGRQSPARPLLSGAAPSNSTLRQLPRRRHHHGQRPHHHLRRIGRRPATSSMSPTISTTCLRKIDAHHRHGDSVLDLRGSITLHSGTSSNLSITSSNAAPSLRSASPAL